MVGQHIGFDRVLPCDDIFKELEVRSDFQGMNCNEDGLRGKDTDMLYYKHPSTLESTLFNRV